MQAEDINEFTALVAMLSEVFEREPSKALVEVYFRVLSAWSIDEVNSAVWEHIATGQYFPKPAELITLALTYRTKQLPPAQPKCAIHGCPGDPVGQFCAYHGG
jgi:hypothetical protein